MHKIQTLVFAAALALTASCKKSEPKQADPAPAPTAPAPAQAAAPTPPAAPDPAAAAPAPTPAAAAAPDLLANVRTGGQPTDEQLEQAKKDGVKTVINLRGTAEAAEYAAEEAKVKALGMTYVHIPIDGKTGDGLNEANARKLGELLAAENKPVMLHCATGQRVGALLGLRAYYVDGATPEAALATAKANGLSKPALEKIVADIVARPRG
jgi:uncharacterized protein (TIGR01244 family)